MSTKFSIVNHKTTKNIISKPVGQRRIEEEKNPHNESLINCLKRQYVGREKHRKGSANRKMIEISPNTEEITEKM